MSFLALWRSVSRVIGTWPIIRESATYAMRIIDEWQSFIHTHFQTDGQQLPSERVREIEHALVPTLRKLGIVFGFHLEREAHDPGIRVVLECRPAERELAVIRRTLGDTLKKIPRRPRPTLIRFAKDAQQPHASAGGTPRDPNTGSTQSRAGEFVLPGGRPLRNKPPKGGTSG